MLDGSKTLVGSRMLSGVLEIVDHVCDTRTKSLSTAFSEVVDAFPPRSQGRKEIVGLLTKAVGSSKIVSKLANVTQDYAQRAMHTKPGPVISNMSSRLGVERCSIRVIEGRQIIAFTRSEACFVSGQAGRKQGETLYTEQSLWRFYSKWKVECFACLLREAHEDPKYTSGKVPTNVTVHEANVWHVLWASQQPGFDLCATIFERAEAEWRSVADKGPSCSLDADVSAELRRDFDPSAWTIIPRSWKTLRAFLEDHAYECDPEGDPDPEDVVDAPPKPAGERPYQRQFMRREKAKKHHAARLTRLKRQRNVKSRSSRASITLLSKTDTHFCPLCDKGPGQKRELASLLDKMESSTIELGELWMLGAVRKLTEQQTLYELHVQQLATQRVFNKERELLCTKHNRRGTMTRDFVCFYGNDGSKIRILVFVLLRAKGIQITPIYIYFVYWGDDFGNDAYFFRDGFDHLLCKTGFLDDLDVLGLNGDHGPHFSARCAFYYMSTVFERSTKFRPKRRSGLVVEEDFLTSYHAFNRCDGAGSVVKQACLKWWKEGGSGGWPRNGKEICDMINKDRVSLKGKSSQMVAYPFDVIDRGEEVFKPCLGPNPKTNLHKYPNLRQKCSVHYSWPVDGTEMRQEGVIRVRDRSGTGPWMFLDTRHSETSDQGQMCQFHSNVAEKPVYHGDDGCPGDDMAILEEDRSQPSLARLANSGRQLVAEKKQRKKRGGPVTVADYKMFLRQRGLSVIGLKKVLKERAAAYRPPIETDDSDSEENSALEEEAEEEKQAEEEEEEEAEEEAEEFTTVSNVAEYRMVKRQDQWRVRFVSDALESDWLPLPRILEWVAPKDHDHTTKLLLAKKNEVAPTNQSHKRKRRG